MSNEKIIKELDVLSDLIKNERYTEAQQYITKIKNQAIANEDIAGEYMDKLLDELK